MDSKDPRILLSPPGGDSPPARELGGIVSEARRRAEDRLGVTFPGDAIRVKTCDTLADFYDYLGSRPKEVVAIARARLGEVVINREAWDRLGPAERRQVMTHEMSHLIMGRLTGSNLPLWLDEGFAMMTAGEDWRSQDLRIVLAGTFGGLKSLSELEHQVLFGGESQRLAYAQSLSVTRFAVARFNAQVHAAVGDPAPLARYLTDPVAGPGRLDRFWNRHFRDALELQWRRSQRDLWSWLGVLSGGATLWGFSSLLFLAAYWRKRRFARMKMEAFGREEETDRELGLEPSPSDYGADWDVEGEDRDWKEILEEDDEAWKG